MSCIKVTKDTVVLHIVVVPKSSKDGIVGLIGDELKITITAPPVDGKANEYICKYLSKLFKTAKSNVSVDKGTTNKHKTISIINYSQIPDSLKPYL
ncbi:MAG: DUF167 family protein [Succinivibrionaceae bacterium]